MFPVQELFKPTAACLSAVFLCRNRARFAIAKAAVHTASANPTATQMDAFDAAVDPKSNQCRLLGSIKRSRKVRGGNYVQIATVDEHGRPHCRTVVFRGFMTYNGSEMMKMITDARSVKVKEIQASGGVSEMVWWFQKSNEQYRFQGKLSLVGGDEVDSDLIAARKQQWGNLTDAAREQFFWSPPGPYEPQSDVPCGGRDASGKILPAPAPFLLMLLPPSRIEYLQLTDNYRQIDHLDSNGDWNCSRVNP
jgi:PPOX class probable FMN-dependent enzyme